MKNKYKRPSKLSAEAEEALSKKAEKIAKDQFVKARVTIEPLSTEEKLLHLHNLQVQQIELELQNEELRRTQIDLEKSRERYFELYNLAPVGYCSILENGIIKEANLTIATMLGVSIKILIGSLFSRFILKDDSDAYYLHRKNLFEKSGAQNCELRLLKKDGSMFWADIESTLAHKDDGSPVCRTSIIDVSKRKEAELMILSAKNELEIKVAERTSELAKANEQLQSFTARMLRIMEDERKGIARDLHDQVGQSLTVLNLMINQASRQGNEQTGQTLAEARKVISDLVGQVREISLNLRPSILDDLGLLPALTWHIDRYEKQTKIKVIFNHNGLERSFTHPIAETVYRVIQEALTNVAKYAGVTEVQIDAQADDSQLTIMIKDKGKGFDFTKLAGNLSFGLRGMSERLFAVGGTFKIDSQPGSGTILKANIPLK